LAGACTLTRVKARVKELNFNMTGDIVVRLRGGTYSLGQTLQFDGSDNGQYPHKVIWQAYPGEKPILSGGTLVTNWVPEAGIYRALVSSTFETRQLWVNGMRAVRARGPLNPAGFSIYPAGCPGALPNPPVACTGYSTSDNYMKDWINKGDIEFMGFNQWKSMRCGVSSISPDGTLITMDTPCFACAHADVNGNTYPGDPADYPLDLPTWVENARELLDEYGEWYLDRTVSGGNRKLWYKPRPGETPGGPGTTVIAATLDGPLVRITGIPSLAPAQNIVFSRLNFLHDTWLAPNTTQGLAQNHADYYFKGTGATCSGAFLERAEAAVEVSYADRLEFSDNVFTQLGRSGLSLRKGVSLSVVQGNVFSDISGTGLLVGEVSEPVPAADEVWGLDIKNNYITRAGAEYFGAVGMFMGFARDNTVSHNEIFSLPYNGLNVGWYETPGLVSTDLANNEISGNLIRYAPTLLSDGGLAYMRNDQNDSTMTANFLHNQNNMVGGFYLDNATADLTVGGPDPDDGNVVIAAPMWRALNVSLPTGQPAHDNIVINNWADRDDWTTIEAENYTRFYDTSTGNNGNVYRFDNVDILSCAADGCSNGYAVNYTPTGEWLEFDEDFLISAPSEFALRVSRQGPGTSSAKVCIHDVPQQPCGPSDPVITVPATPDWHTYVTTTPVQVIGPYPPVPQLPLIRGRRSLRIEFSVGFNLDAILYRAVGLTGGPTDVLSPNTIVTNCTWPAGAQSVMTAAGLETAYRGIPGPVTRYEAEDFNIGGEGVKPWTATIDCKAGYHDLTTGNLGGAYRNHYDVDIYQQWSASNGYTLGYPQEGEWVRYNIDARQAGNHAFELMVATTVSGSSISLEVDGMTAGNATVAVPVTGSFDVYQKVTVPWTPNLTAGFHVVRLIFHGPGFTFDFFETRKL
jgi:hypothetical protein